MTTRKELADLGGWPGLETKALGSPQAGPVSVLALTTLAPGAPTEAPWDWPSFLEGKGVLELCWLSCLLGFRSKIVQEGHPFWALVAMCWLPPCRSGKSQAS